MTRPAAVVLAAKGSRHADYLHDALDDLHRLVKRRNVSSLQTGARKEALESCELGLKWVDREPRAALLFFGMALGVALCERFIDANEHTRLETLALQGT